MFTGSARLSLHDLDLDRGGRQESRSRDEGEPGACFPGGGRERRLTSTSSTGRLWAVVERGCAARASDLPSPNSLAKAEPLPDMLHALIRGDSVFRQMSIITLCAVAVVSSAASLAWGQASFRGVGDLPGGETESFAYGVSGDGSTVVGMSLSASGQEAFRFKDGVITGLGDLPDGAFDSVASGASFDGSVIVGAGNGSVGRQAVLWSGGPAIPLPGLLPEANSEASGVSANGALVVGWSSSTLGVASVRWENGTAISLGDLPGGSFESRAQAVSADGATIVGWGTTANGFEAFRWATDVMSGLGFLQGGSDSQAFGISADGDYIAGYSWSNGTIEAAVWHNGIPLGLGFMAGGSSTEALNLSADGKVVVGSGNAATGAEAFIWDARHGIRPLKQLLVQQYGLDLQGWSLQEAYAVSDDGRTIVGTGTNPAASARRMGGPASAHRARRLRRRR